MSSLTAFVVGVHHKMQVQIPVPGAAISTARVLILVSGFPFVLDTMSRDIKAVRCRGCCKPALDMQCHAEYLQLEEQCIPL